MKHNAGKPLMTIGLLLLAAALVLTGYNIWDENRANREASSVVDQLPQPGEGEENHLYPNPDMPVLEIDGHRYVGRLTIPALGLDLPVLEEWSNANGKVAPCRYKGSAYTDDLIIAGHNYRSHFGTLKNLSIGEEIYFTDVDGNLFSYTVVALEILDGTAVEDMESGDWALSLFTCTYGGRTRLTLRCK